jgi:hypothetical protein
MRHDRRMAASGAARAILAASLAAATICAGCAVDAAQAASLAPWWRLDSTIASTPGLLPEAQMVVNASNLGDGEVEGGEAPVVLTDVLPAGLTPVDVELRRAGDDPLGTYGVISSDCALEGQTVSCRYGETLAPYERLVLRITVDVEADAAAKPENVVTIGGANAASASLRRPLEIHRDAPPSLAVENYQLTPEGEEGESDVQAGSHPFQLTTTLDFDQTLRRYLKTYTSTEEEVLPSDTAALPRELHVKLPPGLVGDASAVPQCTETQFSALGFTKKNVNLCPDDTAVGVASVTINLGHVPDLVGWTQVMVPVFNLVPAHGEPARFGFEAEGVPVVIKTALPAGGEYAVEAQIDEISQVAQILSSQLTLWGVPDDPSHNSARGWSCLGHGSWVAEGAAEVPCPAVEAQALQALLTLPTSCASETPSTVTGVSWPYEEEQDDVKTGVKTEASFTAHAGEESPTRMSGCDRLPFSPSIAVEPEQRSASTPTGLDVDVTMPQNGLLADGGLAEPALRASTVSLPAGLQLNAASANGLEACSASEFDLLDENAQPFEGPNESSQTNNETLEAPVVPEAPSCQNAAKVGTVSIKTPLLPEELGGSVFLAAQNMKPFKNPLALYLVAEDAELGVQIKLAGEVQIDEQTGQVTTTFRNTPQAGLFTHLHLHLFGGQRAPISTPTECGAYTTGTSFTSWSGASTTPSASFQINSGPGGGSCPPSPLPFAPSLRAGATSAQAGAFSPLVVQLNRPDGQQQLSGLRIQLSPGDAAELAHAAPCPEPVAGGGWSCGPESLLGHATVSAGVGSEPVTLTGQVYLTTGYDGAPFGVLVRTHAAVGPFDLGYVDVRSKITVNPYSAVATITSDPGPRGEDIPTRLDGVPVQLKALEVVVDRPEFAFNPTNCAPMAVTGTLDGSEGAADPVSYPFGVSNCSALPFKPNFTTSVKGQASKADGTTLTVKVTSPGLGQANIAKAVVTLPKQLPSRLTTIQKACLAKVFEANPATCDEGSLVGFATIHTPVLKNPLSGPAYLVSHGNAAFPDLEFVLQGEGLEIVLDGKTDIKKGVTTARFENVPDQPFTDFETDFPAGPHSALTANVAEKKHFDLCGEKLAMPTVITGQNGAVVEQQTQIAIQGCPKGKPLASKLARAITACRQRHKRDRAARASCERAARRRYAAAPKKASRSRASRPR